MVNMLKISIMKQAQLSASFRIHFYFTAIADNCPAYKDTNDKDIYDEEQSQNHSKIRDVPS